MRQEHGTYKSAAGTTVTYWKRGDVTMLLNCEGEITYCPESGEIHGVSSVEAGLEMMGWDHSQSTTN